MNIKQLAQQLDLSIATVSRALNNQAEVSNKTRLRVQTAALQYGYRPNVTGKNLRQGKVDSVALMLPSGGKDNYFTSSFFMRVATSLQSDLKTAGFDTLLHLSTDKEDEGSWLEKIVAQRRADAVILTNTERQDARIAYLHEVQFPFASLGRSQTLEGHFNWVDMDFGLVARQSVAKAVALGYRRIALVTLGDNSMQGWLYLSAYQKAIEKNGLTFKKEYVYFGEISEKTGFGAMEQFFSLSAPPECIIFINDIPVIGAYHYMNVNKLEPEKSIHIMAGIISSDVSSYLLPKPLGFSIQHSQIGQALSHAVLNSLVSQNREFINTLIIPQL